MTTKDVLALALEALAANEFHLVEMGKRGNGLQAQTVKAITAIKQAHQAQSVKIIEYRDQRIAPCGCHPDEACEQCCPELPKPQAQQAQEPVAWEATTPGYIKYVTDKQYRSYSETAKRWYKPYKCSSCAAPKQAEPAEKRKPYECTGCGHLHEEKPSSCDCCENPGNDYNDWTASPTPPEAA
jgi:hypothetical protein